MKKNELTDRLAKRSHLTRAEAADQLDRVVHEIIEGLRKGQKTNLPGLGTFGPGADTEFPLDPGIAKSKQGRQ